MPEYRRLSLEISLDPIGVVSVQRVLHAVGASCYTFKCCDVDKRVIARSMSFFSHSSYRGKLRGRIHKARVSAGDVVINFEPELARFLDLSLYQLNKAGRFT